MAPVDELTRHVEAKILELEQRDPVKAKKLRAAFARLEASERELAEWAKSDLREKWGLRPWGVID